MTPRLKSALWGLRVYGPCSIAELAGKIGRERESVYRAVYELRELGLLDRLGPASYDVTPEGRVFLGLPAPGEPELAEKQGMLF